MDTDNICLDFFDLQENEHALRPQMNVLRDSLGELAIRLLFERNPNISQKSNTEIMKELYRLIDQLHKDYSFMLEHDCPD
ncbi:MAG: hypothetical protein HFH68_05255 [Lachnospiraceae bacterium]|nr:hypothetical protein [Lachnospiraceae bacterium]